MKNKKAFTLMELIVSIFMITVFALFIASCAINVKYANKSNDLRKIGGEEKVRKMPRIFRYSLYLALVVLVWHIVLQIDTIASFFVHLFIR